MINRQECGAVAAKRVAVSQQRTDNGALLDVATMSDLEQQTLRLRTGQTAQCEYDRNSDMLEIFFRDADATCAVELTESIVLRFDWETNEPLSLSLLSVSKLLKPTEYGDPFFQLLADEWPDEARGKIWDMLRKPPLNEFLKLSSYVPAHTYRAIPMTSIQQTPALMRAA